MCMSISAYIFAFYMIRYHEVRIFCHQYLCISVHISPYLCLSVHICLYPVYIRQYQRVSELYPCIYTYICAYMCIYVYMLRNQSPGPIFGSNLTGTNLRVQSPGPISDVHICAYVLISYNICVYQIYICAYICILLLSDYI